MNITKLVNSQCRKGVLLAQSSYDPDNFSPVWVGSASHDMGVNIVMDNLDEKYRYSITLDHRELERICRIYQSQVAVKAADEEGTRRLRL